MVVALYFLIGSILCLCPLIWRMLSRIEDLEARLDDDEDDDMDDFEEAWKAPPYVRAP